MYCPRCTNAGLNWYRLIDTKEVRNTCVLPLLDPQQARRDDSLPPVEGILWQLLVASLSAWSQV